MTGTETTIFFITNRRQPFAAGGIFFLNTVSVVIQAILYRIFYRQGVVVIDGEVPKILEKIFPAASLKRLSEFRQKEFYSDLLQESERLAAAWYRGSMDEGARWCFHNGIPLWGALEQDIGYYLYRTIEKLRCLQALLRDVQADTIVIGIQFPDDNVAKIAARTCALRWKYLIPGTRGGIRLLCSLAACFAGLFFFSRMLRPVSTKGLSLPKDPVLVMPLSKTTYRMFIPLSERMAATAPSVLVKVIGDDFDLKGARVNNKVAKLDLKEYVRRYLPGTGFFRKGRQERMRCVREALCRSMVLDGVPLAEVFENVLFWYFDIKPCEVMGLIDVYQSFLSAAKPSRIVHPQEKYIYGSVIMDVAKTMKIPCVMIQYGPFDKDPGMTYLRLMTRPPHEGISGLRGHDVVSAVIGAMGQATRETLVRLQVPDGKIRIVGSPLFGGKAYGPRSNRATKTVL
ncbi:MAG: hypothetical protein PHS37_09485, partial [Candidatus Omnitrophica bacterium]|nr:hypothetical protein [Candidatus Omnitrophota bacterium]